MKLEPYIFFYGRCAEALAFYQGALGGTFEVTLVGDSPMRDHFPPERHGAVMHASFTAPGVSFMASDGRDQKTIDPDEGNISLSIGTDDRAEGDRVFAALADGGTIVMPLADAPWGARFGMVHDRFGIEWMVTSP
jgi:PhnB protein